MKCGHMGCALLSSPSSSENSDPQKSERPWEYATHMVAVIKCGHLWHKKVQISIVKMNGVGTCFPIGIEKFWLRESHSFGMFLIKKKTTKLLQQISSLHSTCEEVAAGTVCSYMKMGGFFFTSWIAFYTPVL